MPKVILNGVVNGETNALEISVNNSSELEEIGDREKIEEKEVLDIETANIDNIELENQNSLKDFSTGCLSALGGGARWLKNTALWGLFYLWLSRCP